MLSVYRVQKYSTKPKHTLGAIFLWIYSLAKSIFGTSSYVLGSRTFSFIPSETSKQ